MENEIKTLHVIINGSPSEKSIKHYTDKGWLYLGHDFANVYHPYALESDTILFFAKPINKEKYDAEMKAFYDKQPHECEG